MRGRPLGDMLLEARSGFASGARADDGVAQVRMNNLTADGSWDWSRIVRVPPGLTDSDRFLLQPGDVLFNNTNSQELVGKTVLFTGYPEPITFSNHFTRLRPGPELDSGYLAFWLHRKWQSGFFVRASTRWVGQAAFGTRQLLALQIPIVDLSEQRRLAAELTEQLAAAGAARAAALGRRGTLASLRGAMLEVSLGGMAASDWDRVRFGDVLRSPLRTGVSGPESPSGSVLGLSLAAVRNGHLDLTQAKRVDVDPSTNRLVREGCFYIVRGNGRVNLVGRSGLAPRPATQVVFPDLLIEADIDGTKIDSAYFQLVWDTREVRAEIESRARTAAGIHKINLTNLAQVQVPAPCLSQQRRIAAELRERLVAIDAMEASIQAEREAIEALPAALLRRAFADLAA